MSVVTPDRRSNHAVADEQDERLEHVPEASFRRLALANLRANGTKISTIRIAAPSSKTMNFVI